MLCPSSTCGLFSSLQLNEDEKTPETQETTVTDAPVVGFRDSSKWFEMMNITQMVYNFSKLMFLEVWASFHFSLGAPYSVQCIPFQEPMYLLNLCEMAP